MYLNFPDYAASKMQETLGGTNCANCELNGKPKRL